MPPSVRFDRGRGVPLRFAEVVNMKRFVFFILFACSLSASAFNVFFRVEPNGVADGVYLEKKGYDGNWSQSNEGGWYSTWDLNGKIGWYRSWSTDTPERYRWVYNGKYYTGTAGENGAFQEQPYTPKFHVNVNGSIHNPSPSVAVVYNCTLEISGFGGVGVGGGNISPQGSESVSGYVEDDVSMGIPTSVQVVTAVGVYNFPVVYLRTEEGYGDTYYKCDFNLNLPVFGLPPPVTNTPPPVLPPISPVTPVSPPVSPPTNPTLPPAPVLPPAPPISPPPSENGTIDYFKMETAVERALKTRQLSDKQISDGILSTAEDTAKFYGVEYQKSLERQGLSSSNVAGAVSAGLSSVGMTRDGMLQAVSNGIQYVDFSGQLQGALQKQNISAFEIAEAIKPRQDVANLLLEGIKSGVLSANSLSSAQMTAMNAYILTAQGHYEKVEEALIADNSFMDTTKQHQADVLAALGRLGSNAPPAVSNYIPITVTNNIAVSNSYFVTNSISISNSIAFSNSVYVSVTNNIDQPQLESVIKGGEVSALPTGLAGLLPSDGEDFAAGSDAALLSVTGAIEEAEPTFVDDWLGGFMTLKLPNSVGYNPVLTMGSFQLMGSTVTIAPNISRYSFARPWLLGLLFVLSGVSAWYLYKGTF